MSDGRTAAGRRAKDPPGPGAEAPGTGPLSGPEGDGTRPADEWVPLIPACDEVKRSRGGSKAGAAEWLRQAAVSGKVRVRFVERYYALEQSKGARYLALRSTGPRTDEEAEFLARYTPSDPLDLLRDRPDSMKKHEIKNFTEWHLGDLKAELARDRPIVGETREHPASGPNGLPGGRVRVKGPPGRPPQDKWVAVLVEAGAWLTDEGDPGTDEAVANFMAERFAERGWGEPSRKTRRKMAKIARDAFGSWRAGTGVS